MSEHAPAASSTETGKSVQASLSVVVITPDQLETVRPTIQALRRQTARRELEIVIVAPSREQLRLSETDLEGFAAHRVVEIGELRSTSVARAAGVRAALASVIAFTEDHCFPGPEWAAVLIERHRESWSGVGPVFRNANPGTAVSWANFIIEYGEWIDPLPGGEAPQIPGHNSSYKRQALLEYGDELPQALEAESTMQWDLMSRGHRFFLEPKAICHHLNYSLFVPSVSLRFCGGRLFAGNRARKWSPARRGFYVLASPLIPFVRLGRVIRCLRRIAQLRQAPRLVPLLFFLLAADGLGEMIGYAVGAGKAMEKLSVWEFHRSRHLCVEERHLATEPDRWMA